MCTTWNLNVWQQRMLRCSASFLAAFLEQSPRKRCGRQFFSGSFPSQILCFWEIKLQSLSFFESHFIGCSAQLFIFSPDSFLSLGWAWNWENNRWIAWEKEGHVSHHGQNFDSFFFPPAGKTVVRYDKTETEENNSLTPGLLRRRKRSSRVALNVP